MLTCQRQHYPQQLFSYYFWKCVSYTIGSNRWIHSIKFRYLWLSEPWAHDQKNTTRHTKGRTFAFGFSFNSMPNLYPISWKLTCYVHDKLLEMGPTDDTKYQHVCANYLWCTLHSNHCLFDKCTHSFASDEIFVYIIHTMAVPFWNKESCFCPKYEF